MRPLTHLKALQALEAALRHGTLAGAAVELGVTSAALGQRIRALEDYIGQPLLVRGSSGVVPTLMTNEAVADLALGFEKLNRVAELFQTAHLGRVTLCGDPDWIQLWLEPRLPRFVRDNPQAEVRVLRAGDGDVAESSADLRVEYGDWQNVSDAIPLFGDYCVPLCSDDNIRRIHQLPGRPQLEGQPLLHLENLTGDPEQISWHDWVARFGFRQTGMDRGVRYSQISHGLQAVVADAGTLLCRLSLALQHLDNGDISMPFGPRLGRASAHGYYLMQRDIGLRHPLVGRFKDWLLAEAAPTRARIEAFAANSDWRQ